MTFLSWLLPKISSAPSTQPDSKHEEKNQPKPNTIDPTAPVRRDFKGKTLGEKQRMFTLMIAELIQWAYSEHNYALSVGDFFRDPRVHGGMGEKKGYSSANSVHKIRLAADLNLFINGVYQTSTASHRLLGERWEAMGGTWGGRFNDGNHYSIEHEGKK